MRLSDLAKLIIGGVFSVGNDELGEIGRSDMKREELIKK